MGIGDEKQGFYGQRGIRGIVQHVFIWCAFYVGNIFPESLVIFLLKTAFITRPDGLDQVDSFIIQADWVVNEIRVPLNNFDDF